jgi:hypothetical protein
MKEKKPVDGSTWDTNLSEAVDFINSSNSFLFSGDIDPDSANLSFFEKIIHYNSIRILRTQEDIDTVKDEIEAVIFCDTPNTKLVPFYPYIARCILSRKPNVIEIDHHFGADSEELTGFGIKLFRNANANTEIIGNVLEKIYDKNPERPHPFSQRNIILGLLTGILCDTVGGKVIRYKEDYDYWMKKLGDHLKNITRWRESDKKRTADCRTSKFGDATQVLDYLNKLTEDQESCLNLLITRIESKGAIGFLSLLPSTYQAVNGTYQSFKSDWFVDIMGLLLNSVPEKSGHAGVIIFEGQNAAAQDCIFVKIRRAVDFVGVDLRIGEDKIKELFGDLYMGGGGHAGAVSFRIHRLEEKALLARLEKLFSFFNNAIDAGKN